MTQNTYPGRLRRVAGAAIAAGVVLFGANVAAEQSDHRAQKSDADELVDYLNGRFKLSEKGAPANAKVFIGTIAVEKGNTVVVYHNPLVTETPTDPNQLADDTIVVEGVDNNDSGDVDDVTLPGGSSVRVMPEDARNPYRNLTLRLQAQKGGPGHSMYEMVECGPGGEPLPDPLVLGTVTTITSEK